jgi:hypothetical protein
VVAVRTVTIAVGMLAASIWVGSLVCLAVVSRVARRVLDGPSFVALFREVGRLYRVVGTSALAVAIGAGLALAWPISVTGFAAALLISTALLVVATAAGMAQARGMTVRRMRALRDPHDQQAARQLRRGAAVAGTLRGLMGVLTLVILVLGAGLVER